MNCPGGFCEPPDDLPGDEPEDPGPPVCADVCNSNASCSLFCTTGVENTTCGAIGMCQSCSASVCNNSGKCGRYCLSGGTAIPCHQYSAQTAGDGDIDGIPDALELALARRFAPTLRMRASAFNGEPEGDPGELYSVGTRMGGTNANWPFTVRPVTPHKSFTRPAGDGIEYPVNVVDSCQLESMQCLEIVYAIPYNWDLGDNVGAIREHRGDSEMYAVVVARRDPHTEIILGSGSAPRWNHPWALAKNDALKWRGVAEFAAAHMCEITDGSKNRVRIADPFEPEIAPTRLFSAEGKHANYFSHADCNSGGLANSDDCDENDFDLVYAERFGTSGGPLTNAGEDVCHPFTSFFPGTREPASTPWLNPLFTPLHYVWSGKKFGDASPFRDKLRPGTVKWWPENSRTCWPASSMTTTNPFPTSPPPPTAPCKATESCCEDYPGHCRCIPIGAQCE